jgi:hypothetical protein
MYRVWLTVLALMATVGTARAELPANATLLDPDIVWDISDPDCATISPDGKLVAYISKGAIWICGVNAGPPTRIAELPDTSTAFMAMPEYHVARTNFKRLRASLGNATYNETIHPRIVVVSGLQWTPSQDGVMFGLSKNSPSDKRTTIHMLMHASIKGVVTALATIDRGVYESRRQLDAFHVTKNKELAIVWSYNPLIWVLSNNRPRASGFDYLLPSTTSDRFLGVEIDTRQLVATDENLRITKRFDVTFAPERGCDLFWSSDERFAICRSYNRAGYPKNEWTGLRLDLKTGEKRLLSGDFVTDRFAFTGRGGEVVRLGWSVITLMSCGGPIWRLFPMVTARLKLWPGLAWCRRRIRTSSCASSHGIPACFTIQRLIRLPWHYPAQAKWARATSTAYCIATARNGRFPMVTPPRTLRRTTWLHLPTTGGRWLHTMIRSCSLFP